MLFVLIKQAAKKIQMNTPKKSILCIANIQKQYFTSCFHNFPLQLKTVFGNTPISIVPYIAFIKCVSTLQSFLCLNLM